MMVPGRHVPAMQLDAEWSRSLPSQVPAPHTVKPVGEYNQARLVKNGNHVEHWLNGTKLVEYELGSPALTKLIAGSKFKDWPAVAKEGQGHIVLQHHGQEVWFKNVRIRGTALKAPPPFPVA